MRSSKGEVYKDTIWKMSMNKYTTTHSHQPGNRIVTIQRLVCRKQQVLARCNRAMQPTPSGSHTTRPSPANGICNLPRIGTRCSPMQPTEPYSGDTA